MVGVSVFSVTEIALGKEQILHAHRQGQFSMQGLNLASLFSVKPTSTGTACGTGICISKVAGLSISARPASMGLMQ